MFDQSRPTVAASRVTGATAVSVALHGALILIVAFLLTRDPAPVPVAEPPMPISTLVFLEMTGPGGGGGGSPEPAPPAPIEIPKTDPPAPVPVDVPPPVTAPPPPPTLTVPIMTPDAVSFRATGTSRVALTAPTGGGGLGRGMGPGRGDGVGDGTGGQFGGGIARGGAGIEGPTLLRDREPNYTSEALRARIQGEVELRAVVLEDGSVGEVEVVRSLDRTYGLDIEAIKAARQWRFVPARQNGKPVKIVVSMFIAFRIN